MLGFEVKHEETAGLMVVVRMVWMLCALCLKRFS
jgi:hypothetical protein